MKLFFNFLIVFILFISNANTFPQNSTSLQYKNEALFLMNDGRYGEAIDLLNKFVSENPQRADGFNLRGVCYEKRGNYENALYDFRTAKRLSPNDKEITSNLNRSTKDWYKLLYNKIEGHKREIAINPNFAKNYLEIGKCYKNLGEWNEAEVWYDLYLEKEEASADEILRYAEILAKNNHIAKGEPILKNYTEMYPTDHRLWSRYGYFVLWLGKNKLAIQSFTTALEIRPYFKEALDGLDLAKGKGYIYSINDTTSRFNYGLSHALKEYIIDKYFRIIKNNPADDNTRFKLIEELIKVNRYEEGYQQLIYLSSKYSKEKRYTDLWGKLTALRTSYYSDRIRYFEDLLIKNPENKNALLELGRFYSYQEEYDLALQYYRKYLIGNPNDGEVRFKVVQLLMWQNNLCEAKKEIDELLKSFPENIDYQLLAAKLNLWLNQDLSQSEKLLENVISKQPNNIEALSGLAKLKLQSEKIDEAEILISKLELIDKNSPEISQLKNSLELARTQKEETKLYQMLEDARKNIIDENYDEALKSFNKYFSAGGKDPSAYREMADVYLKQSDFNNAIKIYDMLLSSQYDYEIDKQRAKVILWNGDSLFAVKEFKRLVIKNPDDIEVKLLLGDSYLKAGQTQNAKRIYEELLSNSPNSHIIKLRLGWLGGSDKFSVESFPRYLQLIPQGFYFTDNTDFKLNNIGVGLDLGITNTIAIGISGSHGNLSSSIENLRFNQFKGSVYTKLNEFINGSVSFGQTYFVNNKQESLFDLSLSLHKKNIYTISAFLNYSDAVFILYSPYLISKGLNAYYYGLNAEYKFKNNFVLSGKYAMLNISDNNQGNQFQARLGKTFENDITAGYEYYYYSLNNFTSVYWSPNNFESHSLWIDWNLFNDETTTFGLGGKVGLIPQNDYILSEFYATIKYQLNNSISFNAKVTTGSSSRSNIGYRSTSFQASLFWNL